MMPRLHLILFLIISLLVILPLSSRADMANDLCYHVPVSFTNASDSEWKFKSVTYSGSDDMEITNGDNYKNIQPGETGSFVLDTAPSRSTHTAHITYEDLQGREVTFSIVRDEAEKKKDSKYKIPLSSIISPGSFVAKQTEVQEICEYKSSGWSGPKIDSLPYITFSFLDPPTEHIDITLELASPTEAKISSEAIYSLLDANLIKDLDLTHGKPIKMTVDESTVTYSFEKECTSDSCGY